ncbi:MAG TPA: hypothetical protein VE053_04330 [Allosphingosinicella sp.]|nr:hypothetical protein [Allosphingosinicella sp.]
MRRLAALLIFAAAPAAAQPSAAPVAAPAGASAPILEAMRRDFPLDHRAIAASFAGKPPEEARRLAYEGIDRFLRGRRDTILAAPGPLLVAIEARQGPMLRALGKQDVRLCASVGDRGFFSREALAGAEPAGLADYGLAMVEAAKAGFRAPPTAPATKEDFEAWLAAVGKVEPAVPVRAMLFDPALRAAASADHLCRGAAAMHEAVAELQPGRRDRIARTVLASVIAASAAP